MKRLMIAIGAVATAFGLYAADDPAAFATSFEANDAGVVESTWTPPSDSWTWAGATPLGLTTGDRTLPYTGDGYDASENPTGRRDAWFKGLGDNNNWLKLETGNEELTLAVTNNSYKVLDQLVQFTGFEEAQTNLAEGAKIAVWMSEFEGEDDTTTTNLFVTCGKVTADGTEPIALQIKGDYELGKWYHLTIKSIGDIYGGEAATARAGFYVYVDGTQVSSADEAAKALIFDFAGMTDAAQKAMAAGKLFPSFAADATFAAVSYKGIGAIDDIIVDEAGPAFRDLPALTIALAPNVILTAKKDDVEMTLEQSGVLNLEPGTWTFSFSAAEGYVIEPAVAPVTVEVAADDSIDYSEMVTAKAAIIEVAGDDFDKIFGSVATALAAVQELEAAGDEEISVINISVDAEEEPIEIPVTEVEGFGSIGLGGGVTITITPADATWAADGDMTLAAGIADGATLTVDGTLTYSGIVAGTLVAAELVKADDGAVKLIGEGSITAQDEIDFIEPAETGFQVKETVIDEGISTYTLDAAVDNNVAEIDGVKFTSLAAAFAEAKDGDTITVLKDFSTERVDIDASKSVTLNLNGKKITLDTEDTAREQLIVWGGLNDTLQTGKLTITGNGTIDTGLAAKGIAVWARFGNIDIKNGTYTVFGQGECVFARNFSKVTIEDGLFTNLATGDQCGDVLNAQNQESVLTIQVTGGSYSKDPSLGDDYLGPTFVAPGYKSVKNGDLWSVVLDPVAKIGTKEYGSLEDAFKAAEDGDTITLLKNVGLTKELDIVDFNGTLDLGGFELTNDENWKASGFDWLIDLYVSDASKTSSLTIKNGTLTIKDGHMMYVCAGATLTVDADATIAEIGVDGCANNLRTYGKVGGHTGTASDLPCTINVYGTMTRVKGTLGADWEMGTIDQCLGLSVVNVYEGAVISHASGRLFKMSGGIPTVNVYGGTMTAGGSGDMFHAYSGDGANTVNITGGEFTMGNLFSGSGAGKTIVVSGLGDGCTAKFSTTSSQLNSLAYYCDEGYGPVKDGDWYVIGVVYDITITTPENGTLETSVTNGVAAGTTVTVTATPATGYELESITVGGEKIEGNTFEMPSEDVTVAATFKAVAPVNPDPTEDDPADIPEGETAATRYGEKVPASLAGVSAKSIATWAQGNGKLVKDAEIIEDAFLLDCANNAAAVEEAKKAFKIPSITVGADGTVTVGEPDGTFNGEIKKFGKAELTDAEWSEDLEGKKFFELKLVPINVPVAD